MTSTTILAVLAALTFLAAGCGTAHNLDGECVPYGGVSRAAKEGSEHWALWCSPSGHCIPPALDLVQAGYSFAVDLPLSAVADTVTLPWTISAATNKSEPTSSDLDWRHGNLPDVKHATFERIHGGIE